MRHRLLPLPVVLLLATSWAIAADPASTPGAAHAAPAAAVPTSTTPAPEASLLATVKLLRDNDFKSAFKSLPAAQQAQIESQWKSSQGDAKQNQEFDSLLGQLLAPNAVDQLVGQAEPKLKTIEPAKISQTLMMVSGFLPMLAAQGSSPSGTAPMGADQQQMMTVAQGLLSDCARWVPTSGIDSPTKLKTAIEHLITGVKALGITSAKDLHALAFTDVLDRFAPLVKEVKAALAVYDLQADAFLASITATSAATTTSSTAVAAPTAPRTLTVGFTAFGHPYTIPVKVEFTDGVWKPSKDATPPGMDALRGMLPGAGGGDDEAPAAAPPAAATPAPGHKGADK